MVLFLTSPVLPLVFFKWRSGPMYWLFQSVSHEVQRYVGFVYNFFPLCHHSGMSSPLFTRKTHGKPKLNLFQILQTLSLFPSQTRTSALWLVWFQNVQNCSFHVLWRNQRIQNLLSKNSTVHGTNQTDPWSLCSFASAVQMEDGARRKTFGYRSNFCWKATCFAFFQI